MTTIKLKVLGFHCESCIKLTEALLQDIPGVREVRVKGLGGETEIDAERPIEMKEIEKILGGTGYSAIPNL